MDMDMEGSTLEGRLQVGCCVGTGRLADAGESSQGKRIFRPSELCACAHSPQA